MRGSMCLADNALDEGDYFGGFTPDCAAADDLDHPLGDVHEASLAEALHYLRTATCSVAAAAELQAQAERARRLRPAAKDGWRLILDAD